MKENFGSYVDLSLLKICTKFPGKVTKENQVRGNKKHLPISKFSFKFHHLCLCFEVRLCKKLKNKTNMDNINQIQL